MRDLAKGEQLLERLGGRCPDTLELLQLDVTDPRSLAAAVRCMRGRHPDVLGTAIPRRSASSPGHSQEWVPIWGWAWVALQPWGWVFWGPEEKIGAGFPRPRIQAVLGVRNNRSLALYPTVCNAGVGLMAPLEMCSEQAMRAVFEVNVFGTARTIQAFLPAMKRHRAGRILVPSSVGGLQGGHGASRGAAGGETQLSATALPQGCPSTPCTAPASSRWRGCARAWPSFCGPSTSSERRGVRCGTHGGV